MFSKLYKSTVICCFAVTCSSAIIAQGNDPAKNDDLHALTTNGSPVDDIPSEVLSERSFEVLFEQMYPASEEQLLNIRDKEKKITNTLMDNPKLDVLTDIIQVSTAPGSLPKSIVVSPLHTTTLNVIDSTGSPWPISAVIAGNDVDYTIEAVTQHEFKNVVRISPTLEVGSTNLNLSLVGMPTTITLTVINSVQKYHPSPVIQIDKEGPQAKPSSVFSIGSVNQDEILKNIVLGIVPDGYKKAATSDQGVEAWRQGGSLYLRTRYSPSSPLPRSIFHGPGGFAAYKMPDMPLVVMSDKNGNRKRVYIGDINK